MLIRSRTLTGLLFITLAGTSAAGAAPLASSTHQTEQDKARQEALAPQQQDFQSSQQRVAPQGIPFPEETHCKLINRVDIDSRFKPDPFKAENFYYNEEQDFCICPMGQKMQRLSLIHI